MAKKFFSEHIKRSVKYGLRNEESIVNDYLVNQAYIGLSMDQLINWEKKYKLKIYSKSPEASLPLRVDPGFQTSKLSKKIAKSLYALSNLRSVFAMKTDQEVFNNFFLKQNVFPLKEIDVLIKQITTILQRKKNIANSKEILKIKKSKIILSKKLNYILNLVKEKTNKNFNKYTKEIIDIIEEISKKKFSTISLNKKINYLFKGYNGLGTSYIVFKKK